MADPSAAAVIPGVKKLAMAATAQITVNTTYALDA